jgi:hypothetical protein
MVLIISVEFPTSKARRDQNNKCREKFLIGIIFIILGLTYAKEPCDFPVIPFLLSYGTILVSLRISHILNLADFFDFFAVLEPTALIWSAYAIVSEYSHWQYTNPEQPGFCPYIPYRALVIYLIIVYVINGIFLLLLLLMVIWILLCLFYHFYQRYATFLNRYCRYLLD